MENKSIREYAESIKKLGYKVAISYKEDFGICGNDKGSSSFLFNEYENGKTRFEFCYIRKDALDCFGYEIKIDSPNDITKEIIERTFHVPDWVKKYNAPNLNPISLSFEEALERYSFKIL